MKKNYYIILGINSEASEKDIKEAYRKKVQKYHPDHYGSDSSHFILIQEAYNVLGDPKLRRKYDENNIKKQMQTNKKRYRPAQRPPKDIEPLIPESNCNRSDRISLKNSFEKFSPSFSELLDHYWRNFTNLNHSKGERLENLSVEILINPEEAKYGGQIKLLIPVRKNCPYCHGFGSNGFWDCSNCTGYGIIEDELPLIISFPGGIKNQFNKSISLNRYGINNFYLTINFRVS